MHGESRKRILVTGGAGFLGSHLCERLLQAGHRVYCLDNLATGSKTNMERLLAHRAFTFLKQDVRRKISLEVDEIYNLACPASPVHYQSSPVGTIMTCVLGAQNVLYLARRCGAKVLQASTSEIYGDPAVHPQNEDYRGCVNAIGPRACYDEGKRMAETLFFDHHRRTGLRVKVARIFNTYGPRMLVNDGRIISNFVTQALSGEPLTVYGSGMQTRSLCYVSDLVDGLVRLMDSEDDVTGPLNLGNPDERRVLDIARLVLAQTGSKSAIVHRTLPLDDPVRRCPDISRARAVLGWSPVVQLEDGLRHTIAEFRRRMSPDSPARQEPGRASLSHRRGRPRAGRTPAVQPSPVKAAGLARRREDKKRSPGDSRPVAT